MLFFYLFGQKVLNLSQKLKHGRTQMKMWKKCSTENIIFKHMLENISICKGKMMPLTKTLPHKIRDLVILD